LIWYSTANPRLSTVAYAALNHAELMRSPIYVPTIVVVEMRYLVEKKTITEPENKTILADLRSVATVFTVVTLDLDIAEELANIPRTAVSDMPDRIIAATALAFGLPLVTADHKIRQLANVATIW
jgi:predicted nucleic acid-binding protein